MEGFGGLPHAKRTWFYDVRSPARRMAVSTHEAESLTVVSLWQGDTCTATFRLPLGESARLISTLAYGMAVGVPEKPVGPRPVVSGRWMAWLQGVLGHRRRKPGHHLWVVR